MEVNKIKEDEAPRPTQINTYTNIHTYIHASMRDYTTTPAKT